MACLYLLHHLVRQYGRDAEVTRCLDSRVFYVCPRLNPDGAEWALADVPQLIRSSTRPYPTKRSRRRVEARGRGRGRPRAHHADPRSQWAVEGVVQAMPGCWCAGSRAETGGQYYRLLPEGTLEDYDGITVKLQPRKEQLDLNRNFPANWRQEHEQYGAGPFPAQSRKSHAAVRIHRLAPEYHRRHDLSHVQRRAAASILASGGRYPAGGRPVDIPKIGARGSEVTGYPNISVFHDFRYHPKEVITGSLDDWVYEHGGVFAWTVEIWSPQRQAGIADYKFIDWYREHPEEDDLKLLAWNDSALQGKGFVPWYAFEHPQLGPVELGGWNTLFTWSNPPPSCWKRKSRCFRPGSSGIC